MQDGYQAPTALTGTSGGISRQVRRHDEGRLAACATPMMQGAREPQHPVAMHSYSTPTSHGDEGHTDCGAPDPAVRTSPCAQDASLKGASSLARGVRASLAPKVPEGRKHMSTTSSASRRHFPMLGKQVTQTEPPSPRTSSAAAARKLRPSRASPETSDANAVRINTCGKPSRKGEGQR